jgi:flagellar hook-basal body complex protein FliE
MSTIGQINRLVPGLQNGIEANPTKGAGDKQGEFTEIFGDLLDSVNELHQDAAKATEMLASGDAADLHQVMIAAEKAGIATELLLEIRNRLVDAYQQLVRMPM